MLIERHPKLRLEYVKPYEIAALPAADQKLYAEIIYSWLITRIFAHRLFRKTAILAYREE